MSRRGSGRALGGVATDEFGNRVQLWLNQPPEPWRKLRQSRSAVMNGLAFTLTRAMGTGAKLRITHDGRTVEGWVVERLADVPVAKEDSGKGTHSSLRFRVVRAGDAPDEWIYLQAVTEVKPVL